MAEITGFMIHKWLLMLLILWAFLPLSEVLASSNGKPYLIEGDIILDKPLLNLILSGKIKRKKRAVVKQVMRTWKDGIVPYEIDSDVEDLTRNSIKDAMAELQRYSCVRFTPRTVEDDYIQFINSDGCFSHIGRQGGRQSLSLGPGCESLEKVLHELMHAVGFFHEQSRYDRDLYVKILWWNIVPGAEKNFAVYSHGKIDTLDIPYDTNSIMHYDNKAFSKNGQNTVEALDNPLKPLGETHLSKSDIKQINLLYKCASKRGVTCEDRTPLCERLEQPKALCSIWPAKIIGRLCPRTCGYC